MNYDAVRLEQAQTIVLERERWQELFVIKVTWDMTESFEAAMGWRRYAFINCGELNQSVAIFTYAVIPVALAILSWQLIKKMWVGLARYILRRGHLNGPPAGEAWSWWWPQYLSIKKLKKWR